MSAVGDIIPLQPQIVITLTYVLENKEHSTQMVLTIRTNGVKPPHTMC